MVILADKRSRRLILSVRPKEKEELIEKKRNLMVRCFSITNLHSFCSDEGFRLMEYILPILTDQILAGMSFSSKTRHQQMAFKTFCTNISNSGN